MTEHMNDAALSVMFNISEGFLRRRNKETSQFLRYSFASNGELKAGYYAAESRKYLDSAEATDLIARMLRRWQATLDVPDQDGPRKPSRPKNYRRTRHQGTKDGPRTRD